jgi:hypothetical protein
MRYTAADSSVYVSEDCYDSVNVITVSDRRVIDTSGNQKRPSACAVLLRRNCHY